MYNPNTPLSAEAKEYLASQGFKPRQEMRVPNWANPNTFAYWATNLVIGGYLLKLRSQVSKTGGPKGAVSAAFLAIPIFAIWDFKKLDDARFKLALPRNLDFYLDRNPLTRNAYLNALDEATEYQELLRKKIAELKSDMK